MLLCREWLYKLIKTTRNEKKLLRNAYLIMLVKQIQNGQLIEPFNKRPIDDKPLLPMSTYLPMIRNELAK